MRDQPTSEPASIGVWVQTNSWDTQAEIDALIVTCRSAGITNIFADSFDSGHVPRTVMGSSTLCNVTGHVVNGGTPMAYLIQEAHRYGIRVHAWCVIYFWEYWGTANSLLLAPMPDNATYHATGGGGSTLNFAHVTPRGLATDAITDLAVQNPGLDGISLDYIRTDGVVTGITAADITSFVSELKAKLPGGVVLSFCSLGVAQAAATYFQDSIGMLVAADMMLLMAYYDPWIYKKEILDLCNFGGKTLLIGQSYDPTLIQPSDFRHQIVQYLSRGYHYFSFFDSATIAAEPRVGAALAALLSNTITANQNDITKVTATPGTSFSITVGGVVQTTMEADVGDHVNSGALKGHIETAIGSENPAIYYLRPTAGTIGILIGDFLL